MQTTDKPQLSMEQQYSRMLSLVFYRAAKSNLTLPQHKILIAIHGNVGDSSAEDIAKVTCSKFNWAVAEPLQAAGMIQRKLVQSKKSERQSYMYSVTEYGKKTLKYIATGKK